MADVASYIKTFASFDSRLAFCTPVWLREIRKTAIERFAALGFPGTKDEKWRFTRVRPLLGHDFRLAERYETDALSRLQIDELCMEDTGCRRLAFVNGHFAEDLSDTGSLPAGVRVGSLKNFMATDPEPVQRYLARHADTEKNPFVALNTAHIHDGAFVHIPKGTRLEQPIHLLYVTRSDGDPVVSHPRTLVIADEDTRASIVESYVGFPSDTYFTNAVTEIVVEGAVRDRPLQAPERRRFGFPRGHGPGAHRTGTAVSRRTPCPSGEPSCGTISTSCSPEKGSTAR